ncbi:MAG: hypothetical protein AB7S48_00010 [Bacteroidales bacterium]
MNNSFWVYILENERDKQWTILTTRCIERVVEQFNNSDDDSNSKRLIYYREFDEMILALGHKLYLSFLDRKSIEYLIRKENPNLKKFLSPKNKQ